MDEMTTRTPLVSIITPTLNREHFLPEALDCIANQTYENVEHIVIDGASTDGTRDLLAQYPAVRWLSEPDNGMYDAINKGLRMAKGEILAYLNSDDLYQPYAIERVVGEFARTGADFVFGDALHIDANGAQSLIFQPPFFPDDVRRSGFLVQPTVFWHRRVYEAEGGFDASLSYVADCEYWMRAAGRWQFLKLDEIVAVERDHAGTHRSTAWDALSAELVGVRNFYVQPSRWRELRNGLRSSAWHRIQWWRFAVRVGTFRWHRTGRWRSFLANNGVSISWLHLIMSMMPRHAERWRSATTTIRRRSMSAE